MGLYVVMASSGESPTIGASFVRESCRALSLLSFLIGYLMIFFNQDRRCLHDYLAKTKVLSDDIEGSSHGSAIGIGVATIAVIGMTGFYVMFFTSLPLKHFAKNLEASGVKIEGISGSIAKGVAFEQFSYDNELSSFTASNGEIKYTISELFKEKIRIDKIILRQAHLKLKKLNLNESLESLKKNKPQEKKITETAKVESNNPINRSIELSLIDINKVTLEVPNAGIYKLDRFFVEGFLFSVQSGKFISLAVAKTWVKSDKGILNIDKLDLNINELEKMLSIKKISVVVEPVVASEYLAGPIDLSIENLTADIGKAKYDGTLKAFRNSFELKQTSNGFKISAENFQPSWYFKKVPPIHSLSFISHLAAKEPVAPAQGSYVLRGQKFEISLLSLVTMSLSSVLRRGTSEVHGGIVFNPLNPASGLMFVDAHMKGSKEDKLSRVYFGKTQAELSEAERSVMLNDAKYIYDPTSFLPLRTPAEAK